MKRTKQGEEIRFKRSQQAQPSSETHDQDTRANRNTGAARARPATGARGALRGTEALKAEVGELALDVAGAWLSSLAESAEKEGCEEGGDGEHSAAMR
jgi:hypothetical protein